MSSRVLPRVEDLLARADELAAADEFDWALDLLRTADLVCPDARLEARMATLRNEMFMRQPHPVPAERSGPYPDDPFAGVTGPPEVEAADLTADLLGAALAHRGRLLARGLIPPHRVRQLCDDIDRSFDAYRAVSEGADADDHLAYYRPLLVEGVDQFAIGRAWASRLGTLYTADSPRSLFDLFETCYENGVVRLITRLFNERPAISVGKSALKRVEPDAPGGWHQDAYVFPPGTQAVNMWVSLSPSGVDAPGLHFLPRQYGTMVDEPDKPNTVTEDGEVRPLTPISQAVIDELARETPIAAPEFGAGDVLFFDMHLVHQTGIGSGYTKRRYGLECWFFGPSTMPLEWVAVQC